MYQYFLGTRRYRCVHLGVVVSRVCDDFLVCQARVSAVVLLLFVKSWLRLVEKEL